MSVIIRLQNLPWSANSLDIRNYFRGLSIPEGGVHIVGGELGDAFIAFSTDEDARQAMMLDGGKIKEIQVKLLLSSRSEMHKVIETARQTVPILALTAPAAPTPPAPLVPPPPPAPTPIAAPSLATFAAALGPKTLASLGIPGLGNPLEIPQPAVIEPPALSLSPPIITTPNDQIQDDRRRSSREDDRRRSRSRSRSRDRERKDRKRDRRDRSRSRERRRRERSRSRDRRDRKRDRVRSWSRDRNSPLRRNREDRRRSPPINNQQPQQMPSPFDDPPAPPKPAFQANRPNGPPPRDQDTRARDHDSRQDPAMQDAYNRLQELGKKRNPNAFQGDQNGGVNRESRFQGGMSRGGGGPQRGGLRRDGGRASRYEPGKESCVAIRNAPTHTSYGDVRRFFPFMIDKHGIKMINDANGRRTGTIYVRFIDSGSQQLALQRKNNELKNQIVTVEHLEDAEYEAAVDSFLPFRQENDDDESLVIIDPEPPSFSVLRLGDLPFYVKELDIIKAFSDFSLLSISLTDCRETRSKTAFVQFAKTEDARMAFERKSRLVFGRRNPTVSTITDEEFEKLKLALNDRGTELNQPEPPVPQPQQSESPPDEEMPQPPQIEEQPAHRDPRQRRNNFENAGNGGPPAPQPPPFFPAPNFAQQQPFGPSFGAFGGFPPTAPQASDPRSGAAPLWGARPPFVPTAPAAQNGAEPEEDERLDCVLMKGLPREATDRTIVKFLSETGSVPSRIHLMLDTAGLPSGDCFCEFRTEGEARFAARKHGSDLDGYRVSVDLVPHSVVNDALDLPKVNKEKVVPEIPPAANFFDAPSRGGFVPRGVFRGRGGFDRGFDRVRGGFDRGGFNPRGRGGFDRSFDSGRFELGGRGGFDSGRAGFDGVRSGFDSRGGFDNGRGAFDRGGRGGFDRAFDRGRGRGFGRGASNASRPPPSEDAEGLEDFGAPGCVVSMENVPFRATVDDILRYFSEFELSEDDVIRRFNERGQPTGDARIAFRTPFDAQRAVKTHHMEMILDRRISLSIL